MGFKGLASLNIWRYTVFGSEFNLIENKVDEPLLCNVFFSSFSLAMTWGSLDFGIVCSVDIERA